MSGTFKIREILNPLQPNDSVVTVKKYEPLKPISHYLDKTGSFIVSLNGRVVPEADYDATIILENDFLVVCPVIAGGNNSSSKNILRIAALIAVAYFSGGVGSTIQGNLALSGSSIAGYTSTAFWTSAVAVAGGLVVNALLPPPQPPKQADSSPTYGIDGIKNTSAEGVVVPVSYGKIRYGGNIVNNYVVNDGATQWLHMLINAGEGPIKSISDLEINEIPLTTDNFKDFETEVFLGTPDQGQPKWFNDTIVPQSINFRLTNSFFTFTTSTEVDRLRFDFVCPAGLNIIDSAGDAGVQSVALEIQYRRHTAGGTEAWQPMPRSLEVLGYTSQIAYLSVPAGTYYVNNAAYTHAGGIWPASAGYNGSTTQSFLQVVQKGGQVALYVTKYDSSGGGSSAYYPAKQVVVGIKASVPIYSTGTMTLVGNQSTPLRRSYLTDILPEDVYDVRVRRTGVEEFLGNPKVSDTVYWSDLNEITTEKVAYRHSALLALKIRLSEQLNGIPTVTHINHGRLVRTWNFTTNAWNASPEWSDNPAWIALDILTNKRFGLGASLSRFDMVAWRKWAQHCETNNLTFNGVFDTSGNVWDSVQLVFRCGHAQITRSGTKYSVAIEAPDVARQMFSVANMVPGSFSETWMALSERSNEIEGTFSDEADSFRQKTIRVFDKQAIAAGSPQRTSQVNLFGVTNAQRAWDDLWLMLNMNRYIQRTVEFSVYTESISSTVGDVIYVQHDMPKWGVGGRVDAGCTTTTLNLDREVTLESGKSYSCLIHHSAILRYTGSVSFVLSQADSISLTLSGFDGSKPVKRIKIAGKDLPVLTTFSGSGSFGVTIPTGTTITAGASYELWDTDVIETMPVLSPAVGVPVVTQQITLSGPLLAAPDQFTNFMFGEVSKVAKPFRIKRISGSQEYTRNITAIEYNETVYNPNGAVPTPNYSSLTSAVNHVTIDGIEERLVKTALSYKSVLYVRYTSTQQTYKSAKVYASRNGGEYSLVGEDFGSVAVDAGDSETIKFKVVAQDVFNKSAPYSTAPETAAYVVQGKTVPPSNVGTVTLVAEEYGIRISWPEVPDFDVVAYELRAGGSSWETATFIDSLNANTYLWRVKSSGTYTVRVKAIDAFGNYSVAASNGSLTVTTPSVPAFSVRVAGPDEVLEWTAPVTGFVLDGYELRYGPVWDTATKIGTVKGTSYSRQVDYVGNRTYWIAPVDATKTLGSPKSFVSTIVASPAPTITVRVVGSSEVIEWTTAQGSLPIDRFELRYGSSFATGVLVTSQKGNSFTRTVDYVGSRTYWIAAYDSAQNISAIGSVTTAVVAPTGPAVTYKIAGVNETLEWVAPVNQLNIDRYEIRQGTSFAAGTPVAVTKALNFSRKVDYVGSRTYWVAAVDSANNFGVATRVDAVISPPGPVQAGRTEVVDNNVLIYWNAPATGSLPVDRYEVKKGATWATGTVIGSNGNSTFSTVFEQESNTYTYWITAYDSANNQGDPVSVTAQVNQPPDYVLRTQIASAFAGTKTNFFVDNGSLIGPVDTSQTWTDHYVSNGWTTPQDQINAGYPIYIQPSVASATYDESYDYGTELPPTTITVTMDVEKLVGNPTVSVQIYYKLNIGDAWTAATANQAVILTPRFRYARVVVTATRAALGDIVKIRTLTVKLANKLRTDSGTFTITDANAGVLVPFNVAFIDADTPICQANGLVPLIPVVDFLDQPNPTSFRVYLLNNGVKVTGSGSWTARGY